MTSADPATIATFCGQRPLVRFPRARLRVTDFTAGDDFLELGKWNR